MDHQLKDQKQHTTYNPQDSFSSSQALENLSLQDRKLTIANLQKIESNLKESNLKAKSLIQNGGDEHTTIFLKLESHLSKIKKIAGETMFLRLCDIAPPSPISEAPQRDLPKNDHLPLESLIKQLDNSLKSKIEAIKPLVKEPLPEAFKLINLIEMHIKEIVLKKSQQLLEPAAHAENDQNVSKNKKKKKNKHKRNNQDEQLIQENNDDKQGKIAQNEDEEEKQLPNDGQIIYDGLVDYKIIKSKISIEHPWKEIDFIVQCDYEGEEKNGVPHGFGRISLVNSNGLNHGLNFQGYGQFVDGKLHGWGYIQLGGGFIYSGTYKHGQWDGVGRSYAPNGQCYFHGHYKQWLWHGQGTMRDRKTGDTWKGQWFENLMSEGVLTKVQTGQNIRQVFDPRSDIDSGVFWSSLQQPISEEQL